ncbi:bifunctional acetate--CoA ligase family protein/GNAT family N-acetyltransferase [Pararhizobium haloflavum]|uniref:bifunctional acetate--CoA ligase family protein/GNAT family N-acetyltransferase n=1 Tax=Pararhizobium haloflavum TaxID=2037914 RepID=UPI000C18C214|nr:bifunctional acetate--CoA ligase family protein/GNAT family N-acetyltransferase [Pararhizobium haloflavum]
MDDRFFDPRSIAVIGASERKGSIGRAVVENVMAGGFAGTLWLVNPKYKTIWNRRCYRDVAKLPQAPDLAVIAVPASAVRTVVETLAGLGAGAAILITAGFSKDDQATLAAIARRGKMRLLGPNCLGLILPHVGVNASFAPVTPDKGRLAFLSQSGAILTSALDWASARSIGFSGMVSLGNAIDIDLPELIDHFADDAKTSAILVYLEAVLDARSFLSAARRAARLKPVVVMKVGRHPEGARAALSHTGALTGSDLVYDAAFRRCGLVRVHALEELFDAAELLSRQRPFTGESLAIATNGGGAGIIAADRLLDLNGQLARLGQETLRKLDGVLPASWPRANPVDIIGDADGQRYADAVAVLLDDPAVHAVLVLRCPTSVSSAEETARRVCETVSAHRNARDWHKPVMTCWLGGRSVEGARRLFEQAAIPTFDSPEDAIRALAHLVAFSRGRETVMRQPDRTEQSLCVDDRSARALVADRLASGTHVLSESDTKALIATYGVPVAPTEFAATPDEAEGVAARLLSDSADGRALVLKIVSPDITHKSDVGGVRLGLKSPEQVNAAAREMLAGVKKARPQAIIAGFAIQPMIERSKAHKLIVGISHDRTFGATVLVGAGGTAVEVLDDKAVELPPLDDNLARAMLARTRVSRLLRGYRHVPPANIEAVVDTLMRLSRLARDLPEVTELDVNPLLVDEKGVIALDARAILTPVHDRSDRHLAIAPWPEGVETSRRDNARRAIIIRPIMATDEALYPTFFENMAAEDIRMRLFAARRHFDHTDFARWTQIDFDREMALVAIDAVSEDLLGVARYTADSQGLDAEFALIVRSDRQAQGIGGMLLRELISYATACGLKRLHGLVLNANGRMRALCHKLGFLEQPSHDEVDAVLVVRELSLGQTRNAIRSDFDTSHEMRQQRSTRKIENLHPLA